MPAADVYHLRNAGRSTTCKQYPTCRRRRLRRHTYQRITRYELRRVHRRPLVLAALVFVHSKGQHNRQLVHYPPLRHFQNLLTHFTHFRHQSVLFIHPSASCHEALRCARGQVNNSKETGSRTTVFPPIFRLARLCDEIGPMAPQEVVGRPSVILKWTCACP
jgi:hypothetical protein